jgi:hypothetical protein
MSDFFQTMGGRKFYGSDVPQLIRVLKKIGDELERLNNNMENKGRDEEGEDM